MWCIKCNVCACLEVCKDKSEMETELSCEKDRRKVMNCENCGDGDQKNDHNCAEWNAKEMN